MYLVLSVSLVAVSILFLGLCLIGARNPEQPWWAGDFLVGSIYVPIIIVLMVFSVGSIYWFVRDYGIAPLSAENGIAVLVIVAITIALWRMMGVKKRLKDYETMGAKKVVNLDFDKGPHHTEPPVSGRRAA